MLKLKTRAVIFDMDGVITNTMPYHYRAWRRVFQDNGLNVNRLDVYSREGQKGMDSVRELCHKYHRTFKTSMVESMLAQKEKLFNQIVRVKFVPGARSFVRKLKSNGFKLGLVTGTSRHEVLRILPRNLYGSFDVVVTGSDVHNGKPHPEPYLRALKSLGLDPKEAIVIENAPFGVCSAKAAGIRCLALETSLPRTFLKMANGIYPSFSSMRKNVRLVGSQ